MDAFLIQPLSLSFLCQVILSLAISIYLFIGVRERSRATWWLILQMSGWTIHYAGLFALTSTDMAYDIIFNWILFQGAYLAGIGGLGFAYEFLGNPFPRETRVALWLAGLVAGGLALYHGYLSVLDLRNGVFQSWVAWKWGSLFGVLFSTWILIVHLRQAVHDSSNPGRRFAWRGILRRLTHPATLSARAHRAFSLVSLLLIVLLGIITLRNAEILPFSVGNVLLASGYLLVLLATLTVYVNYAPVPSSFQVKLVGLSLFSVLAFLGSTSYLLFPTKEIVKDSGIAMPSDQRLRFELIESGYRIDESDAAFEDDLGGPLRQDAGRKFATVDLGFAFPIGGKSWKELYVFDDGLIAFDSTLRRVQDLDFPQSLRYAKSPWIAPLVLAPSEQRSVFILRDSSRVVLSWHDTPGESPRLQTTLHRDGRVVFDYGTAPPFSMSVRGLSAGDPESVAEIQFDQVSFPAEYSASVIIEDYDRQFFSFAHTRAIRLFWLILAASAFILGFFPFFYRGSLVRPLERLLAGVRRVNDGDLKTEVPVTVRDEIGLLTNQFNRMTRSLRRADEDLRTYADTLEQRVEERTVELAEKNQALETTLSELKATQAQLVQQEKLASLGALTAGIAHEIKNPLNFVNNFAGLTAELADELDESLAEYPEARTDIEDVLADLRLNARKIAEHGMRADGIVRSMLEHSRGSKGERQATDLNALLEEYVNLAYHGLRAQHPGSDVTIERDYDASIGRVELVPQEMGRVFLNLLNNAFQAVNEGDRAPTVRISTHRADSHVEIRVADNGPGISEAIREKIFEPFFTTKPAGSGTGLGLSLSHEIVVKGHGGGLAVKSEEGKGATFVVTLPLGRTVADVT